MYEKIKLCIYDVKDKIHKSRTLIYTIILSILTIASTVLAIKFVLDSNIEITLPKIDAGDWLGFIGSVVGVLGAFLVANYQFRTEKRRTEKEKRAQVLLGSEKYQDITLTPGYDIYNQSQPLENIDSLSEMTVKVINAGTSTIYNARVMYEFPNIDNYLNVYEEKSNDSKDFQFFRNEVKSSFLLETNGLLKRYYMKENYLSDEIPYLFSKQEEQIRLPSFYLYLLQYYLITLQKERRTEKGKDIKRPVLKATLTYENYKLEREEKVFYITHAGHDLRVDKEGVEADITIKPYREDQFLKYYI